MSEDKKKPEAIEDQDLDEASGGEGAQLQTNTKPAQTSAGTGFLRSMDGGKTWTT